ncbi:MAG: ribokinase [Pseudomonadales bacterium]|jgi:ribokinase|nr:ribokinase [Pseudomonadales bacterium]MDP6472939.1 ribokinase [Pseudomonadales bacterium]MDP6826304.1 ribokinase [Pseudomonadales bacterium]MDP6972779.1 ribokinase [Pseudomonadales bacterium]
MAGKLVNLGSLCIDHVYSVPSLARAGETIASQRYEVHPGGKGLNQSLAAARAGASVLHVGCVGGDGEMLTGVLSAAGVDCSAVRVIDGASGHAMIQVDPEGRNAIVIHGGANRALEANDVAAALECCEAGDWLLLQNEINDVEGVLQLAAERGVRTAFNVAPVDERVHGYDLGKVDLLIVNEIEAAALAGMTDPGECMSVLARRMPGALVVLTLGEQGLLHSSGGNIREMPAFEVRAVDETATGDAFIGYFMAGLIGGDGLDSALRRGSAGGALAATRPGAASSIPTAPAVADLLRAN